MDKKSLRVLYKQKRLSLSLQQREAFSASICKALSGNAYFAFSDVIHLFLPIESKAEVNTFPLLQKILDAGKKAVVSVSDFSSGTMEHYAITKDTVLQKNGYGIPEPKDCSSLEKVNPEDINMVVMPLLAYDENGDRVGYGRGFYDRFLGECRMDVFKVGVSFFPACDEIDDVSEDDVPLDACFTPDELFFFRNYR
ncbi:MAG: 5-formyltetrahydrofolate cyclo-ligase [Flavobacteriales bacterium]|nr:5-formyltetrahydrofolate cyclo-ligase [Flavobacteriales bacterium]